MIKEKDTVAYRLYSDEERRFYGGSQVGVVMEVAVVGVGMECPDWARVPHRRLEREGKTGKAYLVSRDGHPDIGLSRKEIKRRIA